MNEKTEKKPKTKTTKPRKKKESKSVSTVIDKAEGAVTEGVKKTVEFFTPDQETKNESLGKAAEMMGISSGDSEKPKITLI
jgi:hypothetical protein